MKDAYLSAMSRAAQSVTVVTTDGLAGRHGATVSAMCSVSIDGPAPTMLVCVHAGSRTGHAIEQNRVFCANLLTDTQSAISDCFAGRTGHETAEKFACADWYELSTRAPVLQSALAAFDCRVTVVQKIGSHHVFIGEIQDVAMSAAGQPLVYHNRSYSRATALAQN